MAFIDAHREELGIEPICRELAIAPSSYHEHAGRLACPSKRSARARRDDEIREEIKRVHSASFGLYGSRKVWHQLRREGIQVAKCTVERLMRVMLLAGVRRRKTCVTTVSNPKAPCPLDKVNREFRVSRPNALWVVDFTYVNTWSGFVYVAFVIDAYARRVVGWKVSTSATAGFVLNAREQAIHARRPGPEDGLIHHSNRGVQYLAMTYTQRLAEANLVPSVGSFGDSYDNALAETINGLYTAIPLSRVLPLHRAAQPAHPPKGKFHSLRGLWPYFLPRPNLRQDTSSRGENHDRGLHRRLGAQPVRQA